MTRLLFMIAVGVIAYIVLRRVLEQAVRRPRETQDYAPMVTCVTCGVHLPESTAVRRGGRYYCSASHAGTESR